jgi:hypothetical protein
MRRAILIVAVLLVSACSSSTSDTLRHLRRATCGVARPICHACDATEGAAQP